ncbi:MAG TPA: hypothetical protein VGG33_03040 [Polyangia bacterium]
MFAKLCPRRSSCVRGAALRALLACIACGSEESPRVALPLVVDAASAAAPATNDLGYVVTLTTARMAVRDLQFTTGGQAHARRLDRLGERLGAWLLPRAHAHPGHQGGGEITGELPGNHTLDWLANGTVIGTVTLITGRYRGANFTFRQARPAELGPADVLAGHSIHLAGNASKDGRAVAFTALIDMDEGTQVVGARFDEPVETSGAVALALRFHPVDPTSPTLTVWNGIDFFSLADGRDTIAIGPDDEAHNRLRRAFQIHGHYEVKKQ